MQNAIEVQALKRSFHNSIFQLHLPDFNVPYGYVTGLIGENGAGKTTLLKLLVGMLFPDSGSMRLLDCDIAIQRQRVRVMEQTVFIAEETGLLYPMKLKEIAGMVKPFFKTWDENWFKRCAERFSLDLNQRGDRLSRGQQKIFALIMALARHPRLLILDEPTANLDPLMREELISLLQEAMLDGEISILFSSHITSDLDKIADHLRIFHKGKMLLQGDKETLLQKHKIVKGRLELLQTDTKGLLWAVERSQYGFSAITANYTGVYDLFGEEAAYETPNIEELFLGYLKKERGAA